MCTVSINIDEAAMRQIDPRLTSRESIGRWVQHQMDLLVSELTCSMRSDELYSGIEQDVIGDEEETMDVEELRAMLHETVRKEYARP